jgi:hypothetical protein
MCVQRCAIDVVELKVALKLLEGLLEFSPLTLGIPLFLHLHRHIALISGLELTAGCCSFPLTARKVFSPVVTSTALSLHTPQRAQLLDLIQRSRPRPCLPDRNTKSKVSCTNCSSSSSSNNKGTSSTIYSTDPTASTPPTTRVLLSSQIDCDLLPPPPPCYCRQSIVTRSALRCLRPHYYCRQSIVTRCLRPHCYCRQSIVTCCPHPPPA